MLADRVRIGMYKGLIPIPFVVEDFESGNLDNYIFFTDNTATPILTTNNAYEGQYTLVAEINPEISYFGMYTLTASKYFPTPGYRFSFYIGVEGTNSYEGASFLFGVQDENNYYRLHCASASTGAGHGLDLIKNGESTTLTSTSQSGISLINGVVIVDWKTDGTITVYDENMNQVLSTVDTTFTTGGIGFFDKRETKMEQRIIYYDYVVIEEWIG